jgi:glucosylceramidase
MHALRRCSLLLCLLLATGLISLKAQTVAAYQTTPDLARALHAEHSLHFSASPGSGLTIAVDATQRFQTIDGFGAAMTDSSAWLLEKQLSPAQRAGVMRKLFDPHQGIGISFLRVPLGASDLARNHYSYDDMPAGQRDPGLSHFSIDHDRSYILPAMRQALTIAPDISVMVTPWSPPSWMKTGNSLNGGQVREDASADFAGYLVRSVAAYEKAGVPVKYLSLQNEPLYETPDYPGTLMPAKQQAQLISNFVGPALQKAGIKAGILAYDHNWDHPEYAIEVFSDPVTASFTLGSAFHCYGGDASAQVAVHERFPNKGVWLTECSGGTWQRGNVLAVTGRLIVESSREWSKSVVLWGLALDDKNGPNSGGCATCRGLVTIDRSSEPHKVVYTPDYYAIGQASKFVRPGAVRIGSTDFGPATLESVAFQNLDGSIALLVLNNADNPADFSVSWSGKSFPASLKAGSMSTYVWRPGKLAKMR